MSVGFSVFGGLYSIIIMTYISKASVPKCQPSVSSLCVLWILLILKLRNRVPELQSWERT